MVGMLRSKQAFGFWGKQRLEGGYTGNFGFNGMDTTQFTNGYTFAGGRADRIPNRA
jgi:hypothetical protein